MKLNERFVEYGAGADDVNLGAIPLTDGYDHVPVLSSDQSFVGVKELSEIATSPASDDDLSVMPDDEAVTHQQLGQYVKDLVKGYVQDIETTMAPEDRILLSNVEYRVWENGEYVGSIKPSESGEDQTTTSPTRERVIKWGRMKVTGGSITLPQGAVFVGLQNIGDDVYAIYYYYVYV